MLSIKRKTLAEGINSALINAKDLIRTATDMHTDTDSSLVVGRANMLMQTGLEEVAKASFLFDKYMLAMLAGAANITREERQFWLGGRSSHFKRVERILHLYALSAQMSLMPGTSVIFNESVEEVLEQRNAGLYVDFIDSENRFSTPAEVKGDLTFTKAGFAQEVLNYTRYDLAVSHLGFLLNEKRSLRLKILNKVEEVLSDKRLRLDQDVADYLAKEQGDHKSLFADESQSIFGAYSIPRGGVSVLYTVFRPGKKSDLFLMDNAPNQLMIDSSGSIRHYELAQEPQKEEWGFRIPWQPIQEFD